MVKEEITKILKKTLEKLGLATSEIMLEHPSDESHGDYATNIALKIWGAVQSSKSQNKQLTNIKSPFDLAVLIVSSIPKVELIDKVEAVKPGFINFFLSKRFLIEELEKVDLEKNFYQSDLYKGKKIMVEFAHPNTHKMFHIGHLRNAVTGETLVRILEANGAEIVRANYEGDVGLHIAKCLYSILLTQKSKIKEQRQDQKLEQIKLLENQYKTIKERVEFLGKMYTEGNKVYETDEKAKTEILEINKKIYAKDPEVFDLWKETRQWSLDYFETIYKRIQTHFDRYYFESECFERGKKLVLDGVKKGIFEESEGAIIFPGEKYGVHTRVFVTKEGNTTYEGKDMALGELQFKEYDPDLIIHCVGPEQEGYFQVMFEALGRILPDTKGKEKHLVYGWVKLKHGKMSSREGNVVLGEWLLDEAKARILEIMENVEMKSKDIYSSSPSFIRVNEARSNADSSRQTAFSSNNKTEVAEKAAVAAVKYSLLKVSLPSEIAFDFDESINFEGDSGPYLMYTYARTQSVFAKSKTNIQKPKIQIDLKLEELSLLRFLYRFPGVVQEAGKNYAPNMICLYLFILAQKYNFFYNKLPILKAETEEMRNFRLGLNEAVGIVLKKGLNLLGIEAVEKM